VSRIVALSIDDLLLGSRVREGLRPYAVDLVAWKGPTADAGVECLLVSLHARAGDPLETIRIAKESGCRVIAFAGHKESELLASARFAGADRVVANSSISEKLPEVFAAIGLPLSARPPCH